MRIISFTEKWDKLNQDIFTTFRYPRKDKDWFLGEIVQVYYKNRSPKRELIGKAEIIDKQRRTMNWTDNPAFITNREAKEDGFMDRNDMEKFIISQYGLNYPSWFNKLTLKWVEQSAGK